jgi:signal transduction histidine kinase
VGTSHTATRFLARDTRLTDRRVIVVALATLVGTVLALSEIPPDNTPTELWPSLAASFIWTTVVWDGRTEPGRDVVPHLVAQVTVFLGIATAFGWDPFRASWMALANVGGGVLMAVVYSRFRPEPGWAPTTAVAHVGLLASAVLAGTVVVLLAGFPHLELGTFERLQLWWVIRNTVYAYVGGVTFLFLFAPHHPAAPRAPRWAVALLVPLGAACLYVTYSDPALPLTWFLLLPAIVAGSLLTPRGAAAYALGLALGAALLTFDPINQFGYDGFLPGSLIIDLLLTASTFITLQLAILRDQRSTATLELDRQTRSAQEQAALLATVFDSMSDGIVVMDERRRVVMHNPAARQLLGRRIPLGQELDLSSRLGLPRLDDEPPSEVRLPGGDDPDDHDQQVVVSREDGQRVLDVGAWPLPGRDGRTLVLFSDVTAQRERLGELASFAGVVAHDLRSPLASLSGWLEMAADALDETDGPAASSFVGRARASSDRMQQVIDDWLSYTVQRDGLLAPAEVALKPLVAAVVAPFASAGDDLAPVFDIDVDDSVQADPALTRQLFANLVSNAVKYTSPGDRPRITIRSAPDEEPGFVRITVTDHGIGLPEGEEELVFREFHRAPGHAADYAGTGLGLSLCRKIVVRHGGTIRAYNDDDAGTVFAFTLPSA